MWLGRRSWRVVRHSFEVTLRYTCQVKNGISGVGLSSSSPPLRLHSQSRHGPTPAPITNRKEGWTVFDSFDCFGASVSLRPETPSNSMRAFIIFSSLIGFSTVRGGDNRFQRTLFAYFLCETRSTGNRSCDATCHAIPFHPSLPLSFNTLETR